MPNLSPPKPTKMWAIGGVFFGSSDKSQNGYPPNGRADYDRLYKPSDGLIVRKVVSSSNNQIEIVVQFKNNKGWRRINMEVGSAPPHDLRDIRFNETEPIEK